MENKVDVGFGEYMKVRYKKERDVGLPSRSFSDLLVIKPKSFLKSHSPCVSKVLGHKHMWLSQCDTIEPGRSRGACY